MTEERSTYRLVFHPDALDEWHQLDGSVKQPLKKALAKRLEEPFIPGAELRGKLAGCFKIKLQKLGYRLVYTVDLTDGTVYVLAVGRRAEAAAYAAATERFRLIAK